MIFSFVVPELLLAVALFLLVTQALTFIGLGTEAEVAGLVVWNISWPAIIVRARLVSIGRSYEEAAADLGAALCAAAGRRSVPSAAPAQRSADACPRFICRPSSPAQCSSSPARWTIS